MVIVIGVADGDFGVVGAATAKSRRRQFSVVAVDDKKLSATEFLATFAGRDFLHVIIFRERGFGVGNATNKNNDDAKIGRRKIAND